MKRYFNFLRSSATVSLVVLYSFVTFFVPFSAAAEEVTRTEVVTDPVLINKSAVQPVEKLPEIQAQESQKEEVTINESEKEDKIVTITETKENLTNQSDEELVFNTELENMYTALDSNHSIISECTVDNSPVITFESLYVESQPGGMLSVLELLPQIGAQAVDAEDGVLVTTNTIENLPFPLNGGWYTIEFSATDSDGCVTTSSVDLFILGNSYTPACESGYVYAKFTLGSDLSASLGTNIPVLSEQWFPLMYEGKTFSEVEADITSDPDIAVVRFGAVLIVNVDGSVPNGTLVAQSIADSINMVGANVSSVNVFSGDVVFVEFQPIDCPEPPMCTELNSPEIFVANSTITIQDDAGLSVEEVIALFGVTVSDLDGSGDVSFTHDLVEGNVTSEGAYTITITATDNENCTNSKTVTLVVDHEDDTTSSGCVNPNGCGGSGGGRSVPKEPQGEVLGTATCTAYITTFIKMNEKNFAPDVRKLQIFLNDYMGENLMVDGVYGADTFEAVKRFQIAESDEILDPWGIEEATGIVRETTMRRINNIMCPELNIQIPILYCGLTNSLLYPDGTIVELGEPYAYYGNLTTSLVETYSQESDLVGGYEK